MLCISVLMIGFAVFLFEDLNYRAPEYDIPNENWFFFYAFCFFSIAWSASSIALIFKVDRARNAFSLYFVLLILLWTIFMVLLFEDLNNKDYTLFIGLSIAIYGSLLFGLLFINNQAVVAQIKGKGAFYEEREDILDV